MAGRVGRTVQRGLRTTDPSNDLTTQPDRPNRRTQWKNRTDRRPSHAHTTEPTSESRSSRREYLIGGSRLRRSAAAANATLQ